MRLGLSNFHNEEKEEKTGTRTFVVEKSRRRLAKTARTLSLFCPRVNRASDSLFL